MHTIRTQQDHTIMEWIEIDVSLLVFSHYFYHATLLSDGDFFIRSAVAAADVWKLLVSGRGVLLPLLLLVRGLVSGWPLPVLLLRSRDGTLHTPQSPLHPRLRRHPHPRHRPKV